MTYRNTPLLVLSAVLSFFPPLSSAAPLGGRSDVPYAPLPPGREGIHPVHVPVYGGQVRQLLGISDRWLIVAVYDKPDIVAKVDDLSEGQLSQAIRDWRASEAAGRPNWRAYKLPDELYKRHLAEARALLNERELDNPATFTLTSDTDPAYAQPREPLRVTRTFVSLGGPRVPEAHAVDYAHYCIMELPAPLKNGETYVLRVGTRGLTVFDYDERRFISRAIKVNQMGYLPDAPEKFAYLGAFGYSFGPLDFSHARTFHVVHVESGEIALTGDVVLRERDPHFAVNPSRPNETDRPSMYGEDVYEMDLGPLAAHGTFYLLVPGVGRSWPFRHAPDAYGEAFYLAGRGFYHQRAATALERSHTVWTRPKSSMHHTLYEAQLTAFPQQAEIPNGFDRFDVIGATLDPSRVTDNVVGGWYDAADWDRNHMHLVTVFDLLEAFEQAPERFTDGQLNIPESGDGVPDVLNEIAWGLTCWRLSQDERGGVSGFIEAATHPGYNDTNFPYAFSPRTRWSSLGYAAAAAQFARLVAPYHPGLADTYRDSALRAWAFGINPDHAMGRITIDARRRRGLGDPYTIEWEEKEDHSAPFRVHAAFQLYRLTSDPAYLEDIGRYAGMSTPPFQWRFSHRDSSTWMYADLARNPGGLLPEELVASWRHIYLQEADQLVARMNEMPYRQTWPRHQDFWAGWGASVVVNFNRCLFVAWQITQDERYRAAIINNTDFMLGANPMGMSWTTGLGFVYPIDIQHHMSQHDGIKDPVPGITLYGLNAGPAMHHTGRSLVWNSPGPDGETVSFIHEANTRVPFYRRWSAHPRLNTAQCEFTVHETMSAMWFSTAVLLGDAWTPDAELMERGPRRDALLFGYWPMP